MDDPFRLQHDMSRFGGRAIPRPADDWMPDGSGDRPAPGGWLRRGVRRPSLWLFVAGQAALLLLVGTRLAYIQVAHGEEYRLAAEGNRIHTVIVPGPRGLIKDRFGTVLVENQPTFALYVNSAQLPSQPPERAAVLAAVARALPPAAQARLQAVAQTASYVPELVSEGLPHETAISLMVQLEQLPGIEVVAESSRSYRNGSSLAPLVGYVRKISAEELQQRRTAGYRFTDRIGKAGLERTYESVLRGVNGEEHYEVDAQGHLINVVGSRAPEVGSSLQLHVDAGLQETLTASLRHWAGSHPAAAVALEPTTGGVLALVSLPSFDANIFSGVVAGDEATRLFTDPSWPLFNRAISGLYPSGSTIKPLLAGAALETGIITPETSVLSTGGINVGQWFFPDWQVGGHGRTNVVKAIADSVNTFFYSIGGGWGDMAGLGPERMAAWLKRFGWGKALGIDIPGEGDGLVPSPAWKAARSDEPWYIGDTYHVAIGQGDLLVTPLQVAAATAAIANGGTLYQPQVVQSIVDRHGATSTIPAHVIADHILKPQSLASVVAGMRQAVTSGSARRLASLPIEAAGKTGTAQVAKGNPHAWFTGFAPVANPRIAIAVLIENGGEGSSFAASVAQEALQWWAVNRLGTSTAAY